MSAIVTISLVICVLWYVFCPERAPLPVALVGNAVFGILVMDFMRWCIGGIFRGLAWVFGGMGSLLKGAVGLLLS